MAIQAYGIAASFKSTSLQQTQKVDKGSAQQVDVSKTQEVLFAAFHIEVTGESSKNYNLQQGLVNLLDGSVPNERQQPASEDLSQYLYNGRSILDFSQEEAQDMISEKGYFGVDKTAQRLADFVIDGAGDNLGRLQAGREGILKGFQDAEEIWGGQLPEISYQTLEKTLAAIDDRIQELGGQVVDTTV